MIMICISDNCARNFDMLQLHMRLAVTVKFPLMHLMFNSSTLHYIVLNM